jgi:hypothetical protein
MAGKSGAAVRSSRTEHLALTVALIPRLEPRAFLSRCSRRNPSRETKTDRGHAARARGDPRQNARSKSKANNEHSYGKDRSR